MDAPHVPGFDILDRIRESGATVTWRARQLSLDRVVALKFLKREDAQHPDEVDSFLHVARAIAKLKQPNMVAVYDVVSTHESAYVVMEYVEGQSVAELLRSEGCISPRRAVEIAHSVAEALRGAWAKASIIHRNIKPEEITIDPSGTVKVTDIGLATIASPGEDPVAYDGGMIVGTPNYISPEQAQGNHSIDQRADMYSLGATLYHMITGQAPFHDREPLEAVDAQITDHLPHPRALNNTLPFSVCTLISRLMMKLPQDRYATWDEAIADMDRVLHRRHLHRNRPASGTSTVAAPAAANGKPIRTGTAPVREKRPPFLFRALLWLFMLVWFLWLADWRLRDLESTQQDDTLTAPQVTDPVDRVPAPDPSPSAPPDTYTPATSPPSAVPSPSPAPGAPNAAASALPAAALDAIYAALLQEDLATVRTVLESIPASSDAARSEARRMLVAIDLLPDVNSLVERAIMRNRGREISITHLGKRRQFVPSSCVDGTMHAELVTAGGRRAVSFKVSQLSPEERLNWLPAAEDSGTRATRAMLLLAAGRKQEARQLAGQCGSLAPVILYAASQ